MRLLAADVRPSPWAPTGPLSPTRLGAVLAPALALLGVLAIRAGAGGTDRLRYELLLLLPILWMAMYGTRGELLVGLGGVTGGLVLLAFSSPEARHSWGEEAIFAVVAAIVGLTAQGLMRQARQHAADVSTVTRVIRELSTMAAGDQTRLELCRALAELLGAPLALMLEPADRGGLRVTAAHGAMLEPGVEVHLDELRSEARAGLADCRLGFLEESDGPLAPSRLGGMSAVLAPVAQDGAAVGALVVGWRRPLGRLSGRQLQVIELFTAETARAIERSDLLDQVRTHAHDLEAVVEAARRVPRTGDAHTARTAVCEALLEVSGAMFTVLMEPDAAGCLTTTAAVGVNVAPSRVSLDDEGSATVRAFHSLEPIYVHDLRDHPNVSRRVVEATGAVSALWQPVAADGAPIGVLIVAWDRLRSEFSDRAAAVVGLFAAEAAVAIERADLMARMEGLNRMLAVQVEALRVSDQLKTDFVSSVSHELRTPLASILGYLDVLLEGEVGEFSPEQEEFLQIVDTNARRLLTLINDLLTLSGLESGKTTIRAVPVDMRELVELYVQDQWPALSAKEHTLQLDLPEAKVPAMLDPERIGQVITNVLSNAIKFTPDQGEIGVSLEAKAEELRLTVRDSGIGIAPEDADRLFERFFRARNASDMAIPGTGLGLAICKGIVDAHGGSMAVQSELELGTAVTVTLPTTPHNPGGDT